MLALYAGIFLASAAALFFELTLTRLFAVTQWYHFAFVSVSVALLGFGASGTWLAVRPRNYLASLRPIQEVQDRTNRGRLALAACFLSLSILAAYLIINYIPFDSYRIAWERRQWLYLAVYYPALVVPFFFAGVCSGLPLSAWPERAHALYAANLAGSAAGSLALLVIVPLLGGTGAVLGASLLATLAAILFTPGASPVEDARTFVHKPALRSVYLALSVAMLCLLLRPPTWMSLRLSPYKTLSTTMRYPEAHLVFSHWNSFSRVDVVESVGIHSAPGLSLSFSGELPRQLGLMVDGGNLSPITCIQGPEDERFLQYLPTTLPFLLRPAAQALVVEPRGGLDLLIALNSGASAVVAVESNPLVISATRQQAGLCGASPYDDPRVTVVAEEIRTYLRRSAQRFDVVLLSLTDAYQPVTSAAYSLSEAYAYTADAFVAYLQHLKEDGILVVTRWLQSPPSEELRACTLVAEALQRAGVGDPSTRVIAFRSWSTATILAKRIPFRYEEIAAWKDFCAERSFDLIYYAGMGAEEANRYNLLSGTAHYDAFRQVLSMPDRQSFVRQYPYEVSAPSDDRPFFFHYFKWGQVRSILQNLGKAWQPFGGSGFLLLVALLVLATFLSAVLVLLPLAVQSGSVQPARSIPAEARDRLLLFYFACLGLGYLFVEMPLLQQFILFLGQPAYSFALVLFSILLFSGLGSWLSVRLPVRALLGVLAMLVLAYPLILTRLFAFFIGWSLPVRLVVAVLSLGPLGFLLGLPLPAGVRLLQEQSPRLIPWAWAVNGCASVIGSILAAMGAVMFGFSRVLVAGAFAYLGGWAIMVWYLQPSTRVKG